MPLYFGLKLIRKLYLLCTLDFINSTIRIILQAPAVMCFQHTSFQNIILESIRAIINFLSCVHVLREDMWDVSFERLFGEPLKLRFGQHHLMSRYADSVELAWGEKFSFWLFNSSCLIFFPVFFFTLFRLEIVDKLFRIDLE